MSREDGHRVKWLDYVGRRCIVVEDSPVPVLTREFEVKVIEVSPSGQRVKFEFPSKIADWEVASEWLLVEALE